MGIILCAFQFLKEPTRSRLGKILSNASHHWTCWLMSSPWCHITPAFKHMNTPSMTSAFQQGKPMQRDSGKGKEMGSPLSSDSPFEQPPMSVKRCMLCQKLYLKCVIKLVKRCSKRLGYGSLSNLISATTGGCLQMIQFSITWPDKFFPQLCPSLNMTFLANFRSSPHSMGTLYSNKKKFLSIEMCILLKHISENGQFLLD